MYKYEFILAFQYVWISILDTEANSYSFDSSTLPPLWACNLLWTKFRMVMALIRTGKQTLKESYCASEPGGAEE